MELILIRHALPLRVETSDGSPADPPLGDEGRSQAERLAGWLASEDSSAVAKVRFPRPYHAVKRAIYL